MEAFWHVAGSKTRNRRGRGRRGRSRGRGFAPAGVPVGVFGWREPDYAGGARVGPQQSAAAAAVNASR